MKKLNKHIKGGSPELIKISILGGLLLLLGIESIYGYTSVKSNNSSDKLTDNEIDN